MNNNTDKILAKYGFDPKIFEDLVTRFKEGRFIDQDNIVKGTVSPPDNSDFIDLKKIDGKTREKYFNLGKETIEKNKLGCAIVNGGMATRFGGIVKGIVEVYDKKTFLQIKLEQIKRKMDKYNAVIKIYIMNSYATEPSTLEYLEKKNYFDIDRENIHCFSQFIFKRIKTDGTDFKSKEKPENSFYGSGHGDFVYAFQNSGYLDEFIRQRGEHIWYSNVDNLGATIDEVILGVHIENKKHMTVELAEKIKGDKGGAPAKVDNKLEIVEGFKFPKQFDQDSIPVFNTATYVFLAKALQKKFKLPWYLVRKKVEDSEIIQFERLTGDLSIFLDAVYLIVNRDERFFPIKTQEDLALQKDKLKSIFG